MNQLANINKLDKLSYFDVDTISQVTGLSGSNLYIGISRWIKKGILIQLKNGIYVTTSFYNSLSNKDNYLEFIANKLTYPSYLSLEYVLTKYQILTQSVFTYTSVTQKKAKSYNNNFGNYTYRNIADNLFTGFTLEKKDGFKIATATKSKALFDYLYLKLYRTSNITKELIDSLRLNLDEFTQKEIIEFEGYCELCGIKKYLELSKLLFSSDDN